MIQEQVLPSSLYIWPSLRLECAGRFRDSRKAQTLHEMISKGKDVQNIEWRRENNNSARYAAGIDPKLEFGEAQRSKGSPIRFSHERFLFLSV